MGNIVIIVTMIATLFLIHEIVEYKAEQQIIVEEELTMEQMEDFDLSNVVAGTQIPYRVKQGDTLSALAKKFHCTVEQICQWNDIKDPNSIDIDQKLIFKF